MRIKKSHYNFIALWPLKWFEIGDLFYTFIMLKRKLQLGSFRKAFPNYKGGYIMMTGDCTLVRMGKY